MAKKYSIETVFKGIDKTSAPLRNMETRAERFFRKADAGMKTVNSRTRAVHSGLKKTAVTLIAIATAATIAIANMSKTGAEFEHTMAGAAAKFGIFERNVGEGGKRFKKLEALARSMGVTTEFTALQSAQALNELGMAGFDTAQAMSALPGVLDLATSASVDLGQASEIAVKSLGAFNLRTKDAVELQKNLTRVNDVMAATVTSSTTNMGAFFEAIEDGGPVFGIAGQSMETFAASVGVLADATISGSKAGTALRNIMLRLADPRVQRTLKRLGVQTVDAKGKFKDLFSIMGDLGKSIDKYGTGRRLAIFDKVFGKRAISAATVLINKGEKALSKYRAELEKSGGASKRLARAIRDTFRVEWLNLIAVLDETKIAMFEIYRGPLRKLIRGFKEWVKANSQVTESIGKMLAWLFEHPKLLAFMVVSITALISTLLTLTTVIGIVAAVMGALALGVPVMMITAIVAGLAAVIALLAAIYIWWDDIQEVLSNFFVKVILFFDEVSATAKKVWGSIKQWAVSMFDTILGKAVQIKNAFVGIWTSVKSAVYRSLNTIMNSIDKVRTYLPEVMGGLSDEEAEKRRRDREAGSPDAMTGAAPVLGPQAVLSREIKESNSKAEVVIRDETGKAELMSPDYGLTGVELISSGGA